MPMPEGKIVDKYVRDGLQASMSIIQRYTDANPADFLTPKQWASILSRVQDICKEVAHAAREHQVFRVAQKSQSDNKVGKLTTKRSGKKKAATDNPKQTR